MQPASSADRFAASAHDQRFKIKSITPLAPWVYIRRHELAEGDEMAPFARQILHRETHR